MTRPRHTAVGCPILPSKTAQSHRDLCVDHSADSGRYSPDSPMNCAVRRALSGRCLQRTTHISSKSRGYTLNESNCCSTILPAGRRSTKSTPSGEWSNMILAATAVQPTPRRETTPPGSYDYARQQFVTPGGKALPVWAMATGTPTTYSATTNVGKDNDSDDRGT